MKEKHIFKSNNNQILNIVSMKIKLLIFNI